MKTALRFRLKAWGTPQEPPTSFCLFYFGRNNTTKGPVYVSPEGAERCVAKWKARKIELAADYEHAVLTPGTEGAPASAWFDLAVGADGLYAVNVRWTPRAQGYFLKGEYRYHSPFVELESDSQGKQWLVALYNFALTNWPATDNQRPLVARAFSVSGRRFNMLAPEKLKEVIDALGKTSLSEEEQAELVKVCASGEAMPAEEEALPEEELPAADDPALAAKADTKLIQALTTRLSKLEKDADERAKKEGAELFSRYQREQRFRIFAEAGTDPTGEVAARAEFALGLANFKRIFDRVEPRVYANPAPKQVGALPTAKISEALDEASRKTGAPVLNAEKAIPVAEIQAYMAQHKVGAAKAAAALSKTAK
jgi:hypothetical protein